MTTITKQAEEFEPTGDPAHVGYGQNFGWECTCGRSSAHITYKHRAEAAGKEHEKYCDANGEVTIILVSLL